MTGRVARFVAGCACIAADLVVFVINSLRGVEITWQTVAVHVVFFVMSLLLMDPALGKDVLNKVLHKVKKRGDDDA